MLPKLLFFRLHFLRKYVKMRVFLHFLLRKHQKTTTEDAKTTSGPDLERHPLLDTGFLAIRAHAANPRPPKCKAEVAAEVEAEAAAEVECVRVCVYVCTYVCVRVCMCMYV